jgi:hypothetical protein
LAELIDTLAGDLAENLAKDDEPDVAVLDACSWWCSKRSREGEVDQVFAQQGALKQAFVSWKSR